jgi:anti-sigma B factor antagonist
VEIRKQQLEGWVTYQLEGRFDAHQVPKLKTKLEPVQTNVRLDFTGVSFIDSTGLATLVGLYKKARESNFDFRLAHLQDSVRLILEITHLYSVLPIEE